MNVPAPSGYRIALVDSDALQRACTGNSLTALGADFIPFVRMSDLIQVLEAGQRFDGIIVGLHADAQKTVARVPEMHRAADWMLPLLYLTHRSELKSVETVPLELRAQRSFELLLTPVANEDLGAWLASLDGRLRPARLVRVGVDA
ncbi:hypothetical protein [Variovorax sp. EBFNA2]|uniref:hypothetical protein n=1 Tax=Variovorax sp. EBFNA2 TaxID=3342097 RepID=UPI0029C05696|nr:hypothetical protein [Variovorax boronicumulans]WPG41116.1 hypothetical protein RZE79_34060 [Variovorax boronicumulans]